MSISVTVSGEDSTSVILAQALSDAVTISGSSAVEVTTTSGNSATITVSTGDPITITGNYSNYVTGDVVRPPEISDFLTENQINSRINTATGDYNTLATNSFYAKSNPSGYITGVDLSAYTTEEFVTGLSGSLQGQVSSNDSEIAEIVNSTGSFALKSETGSFISESQTGQFYASSNPSGFITGVDLSSYVQNSETGLFLVSGQDAAVDALDVAGNAELGGNLKIGSTPAYSPTRSIKLHDDGVQYGSRVSLIGTTDNGFPGLEMVTDGNLSKRTLIRHEGEGSNDYGISLYTTDASTVSESVRFAGNGNVGIGQTNPAAPLSVNGNVLVNTNNPDADGTPLVVRGNTDFHGIAIKGPRSPRIYFDEGADGSETELAFFGIQDNDNAFVMRNWGGSSNDLLFAVQGGGGRATAASSEALQLFHNGQMTLNAAWADGVTDSQLYMHVPSASIKGITVDGAVGQTANLQEWKVNGTALSVINSDGNVGIGTDTPSGKLHIAGSAQNSYIEPIVENTAATGAAGFAFKNSNQEWKIGVNTADTFRVRDHNAGVNVFQIESSAPGDSLIIDSNGKTTAKQIEAVSSSYPVLGFTRETSTAGGSFDSVNGIASAMKLITKTSANMTDGFGGGIVFALSDNTFESNANARIYARRDGSDGNAALQFFNKGSNGTGSSMIIRSNGNVGIGTATPLVKLHVAGKGYFEDALAFTTNQSTPAISNSIYRPANNSIAIATNQIERLRVTDSGVGIGTATPDQLLHINRNQNAATNIKIENSNAGVNSSAGINFHSATADGYYFLHGANRTTSRYGLSLADWVELTHGGSDDLNGIVIGTRTDIPVVIGANNNEIARFTDNGVGIGTTTPDELLHLEATSQSATREVLMKATVSDAGNDQFGISNGTSANSNFAPSFYGYKDSNYGNGYIYSMNFRGLVPSSQDTTQTNRFGIIHFETFKSSSATDPNNSLDGGVSNRKVLTVANGGDTLVNIEANGNVGIGTTTPSEKLEVSGNLMLQQNGVIKNNNNNTQFRFGVNDLFLDAGHLRADYSVGIRGNRGSTKGMEQGSTRNSDLGLYCASIEAISIRNDGNVDANYNFTINQDLSVSGDSSFSNRPTVNGTGVLLSGEGGGGTVENVVHTTGDQTISGTKSFGKISLSENSFVTETGSFTMGSTHRGATVLLQNSAPMTVTIPAQVSGHTTTFIAETSNSVVFATGAGISGFNSFNSANQIAGIYGQAQIIFKSPEYAFLGGNVV
jgi:hypothetical protein